MDKHVANKRLETPSFTPVKLDDALKEAFEPVTQLAEADPVTHARKRHLGIPTHFRNIDDYTGGLWPGELTIVTGGTGVGKSSFAANVAMSAAKAGAKVLLITLGISATEIVIRMCAADSRISISNLLNGKISEDDWSQLAASLNRLAKLDMYICDDVRIAPSGLASIARDTVADEANALIVIDGIELMALPDGDHICNWPHTVGNVATLLKKLARENDAPILTTMDYGAGCWRSDIEDYEDVFRVLPGSAESAADSILHINRHLTSGDAGSRPPLITADVLLAKSRLCEPAKIKLAFVPEYLRFMDCAE